MRKETNRSENKYCNSNKKKSAPIHWNQVAIINKRITISFILPVFAPNVKSIQSWTTPTIKLQKVVLVCPKVSGCPQGSHYPPRLAWQE